MIIVEGEGERADRPLARKNELRKPSVPLAPTTRPVHAPKGGAFRPRQVLQRRVFAVPGIFRH